MPIKKASGFVRSTGPRRATKRDLIERFDQLMRNNKGGIVDFPLRYIEDYRLSESLEPLLEKCYGTVSGEELLKGARLAKVGHLLDLGQETPIPLTKTERDALEIQRAPQFWREPKELLLTLFACSLASLTQGWDQAASGNLLWPKHFGLTVYDPHPTTRDMWIFAGIQSIPWFSAAILGSYLSDPLSEYIGRRGALFVAAMCSFTSMVGASQAQSWQALFCCRIVLGIGIGGKASVVPILESEITPSSKRGRLLVGWQVFVAMGLCFGYIASYVLRDDWRHQILSGAIPAFALLTATWGSCESPRWLIIQGQYSKAFTTLVRLRKERILAAKELCSIYYQIQAERWIFSGVKIEDEEDVENSNPFSPELPRTSYGRRLINHFTFPRAAVAAMVVMLSQQFSGINIIAFLATNFFSTADLRRSSPDQAQSDSYKLAIGWAAVNTVASVWAYFLVENKEEPKSKDGQEDSESDGDDKNELELDEASPDAWSEYRNNFTEEEHCEVASKRKRLSEASVKVTFKDQQRAYRDDDAEYDDADDDDDNNDSNADGEMRRRPKESLPTKPQFSVNDHSQAPEPLSRRSSVASVSDDGTTDNDTNADAELYDYKEKRQLRGRRFLLLTSLAGGALSLLITSLCFLIPRDNAARLVLVAIWIMIFTVFYSIGAGAIAFLYCAEIFPNEGREIGMSWSTFWNFFGVGILLLFVPFGINYSHGKLLGIFAGLNVFAFILVFFLVPSTNQTATLEDMSYIFGRSLRQHALAQWRSLDPRNKVSGPKIEFKTGGSQQGSVSTVDVLGKRRSVGYTMDAEIAPDDTRVYGGNEKRTTSETNPVQDMGKGKDPDQIGRC